jgi:hypothetical protein
MLSHKPQPRRQERGEGVDILYQKGSREGNELTTTGLSVMYKRLKAEFDKMENEKIKNMKLFHKTYYN